MARELPWSEALMQRANNLDSCGDFSGGFKLAEAFVTGGDDLGEILVEREGSDISDKCR